MEIHNKDQNLCTLFSFLCEKVRFLEQNGVKPGVTGALAEPRVVDYESLSNQ